MNIQYSEALFYNNSYYAQYIVRQPCATLINRDKIKAKNRSTQNGDVKVCLFLTDIAEKVFDPTVVIFPLT